MSSRPFSTWLWPCAVALALAMSTHVAANTKTHATVIVFAQGGTNTLIVDAPIAEPAIDVLPAGHEPVAIDRAVIDDVTRTYASPVVHQVFPLWAILLGALWPACLLSVGRWRAALATVIPGVIFAALCIGLVSPWNDPAQYRHIPPRYSGDAAPFAVRYVADAPVVPRALVTSLSQPTEVNVYIFGKTRAQADGFNLVLTNDKNVLPKPGRDDTHNMMRQTTVVTRLTATLPAGDRRPVIQLEWVPIHPTEKTYFSSRGALTAALNFAVPILFVAAITITYQRGRLRITRRQAIIAAFITVLCASLLGITKYSNAPRTTQFEPTQKPVPLAACLPVQNPCV